jgi:hypothetical protein
MTAPGGRQLVRQMAYFDRLSRPATMDIGPVLGIEDVIGGKVCALPSRADPRDYIDIAATLNTYTVTEIINFARDRVMPILTIFGLNAPMFEMTYTYPARIFAIR